jgi:hypothetical protein
MMLGFGSKASSKASSRGQSNPRAGVYKPATKSSPTQSWRAPIHMSPTMVEGPGLPTWDEMVDMILDLQKAVAELRTDLDGQATDLHEQLKEVWDIIEEPE